MKMHQEFHVHSDSEAVWAYFQDVSAVADCLRGAELTEQVDDETYRGRITAKLGPVTATFEGAATIKPNPQDMTGAMQGKGVDKKGGSRGEIVVDYRLRDHDGGTTVELDADVKLSGAAARFGRAALLEEITRRLLVDFTSCVEARLADSSSGQLSESVVAEPAAAPELRGASLVLKSLMATIWNSVAGFFSKLRRRLRSGS